MSSTPITQSQAAVANADSVSQSWSKRNRNLLLFSLVAAIYLLPFMWLYTTSLLEVDAVRVLRGEVFGRDFFEVMAPGTFYWNAAFMRLFGANFLGARACMFVTLLGTAACMYQLTQRIAPAYRWLPALLLAVTFHGWPLASHHTDSNFFALLAVVLVIYAYDHSSNWAWLGSGLLTAVTGLTLQPKGVLLFGAILIWAIVMCFRRAFKLNGIGIYVAGVAVAGGAALLYFWGRGGLYDFFYATVLFPLHHYGSVNTVPYGSGTFVYWNSFFHIKSGHTVLSWLAPIVVTPFLFVDLIPLVALIVLVVRRKDKLLPILSLYWLSGTALWLSEVHRKDVIHLAIGSSIWMVLSCYFFATSQSRWGRLSIQLLAICTVAVAVGNFFMIAAAHPLRTRAGTLLSINGVPGLTFLQDHTRPGEYIFAYPYIPEFYFLTDTRNPTRYSLLIYNYNTERQFHRAISEIQRHKVKYVVWQGGAALKKLQRLLPGSNKRPPYGFVMDDYLHGHYHEVTSFANGMQIWERNGDD